MHHITFIEKLQNKKTNSYLDISFFMRNSKRTVSVYGKSLCLSVVVDFVRTSEYLASLLVVMQRSPMCWSARRPTPTPNSFVNEPAAIRGAIRKQDISIFETGLVEIRCIQGLYIGPANSVSTKILYGMVCTRNLSTTHDYCDQFVVISSSYDRIKFRFLYCVMA